jgi:hypothetical protein
MQINSAKELDVYKKAYEISTDTWLDYACDCGYLAREKHAELATRITEVGKMLGSMLRNPDPFILKLSDL